MGLFTPNTDEFDNYYDRARYLLAWRISLCFAIVFAILLGVYGLLYDDELIGIGIGFTVGTGSLVYLRFNKNYKPLFWTYAIAGTLTTHFAINTIMEFPHYVDFLWMVAIILIGFMGLGKKWGTIFLIINGLGMVFFIVNTLNEHIEIIQPRSAQMLVGDVVEITFAMGVIAYVLFQYMEFNTYSQNQLGIVNKNLEEQNAIVRQKNEENVTLLKEVHHRVKNNLQIITSLLRLQKSELEPEVEKKFDEAINRIMTMSLIHQKLYQEKELSKINVTSYTRELCDEIATVFESDKKVNITVLSDLESIGLKTIVPFGLLINELVSNSFKHAFHESIQGDISIKVSASSEEQFILEYDDNGTWVSNENESSFGLELIEILTDQLEGSCERNGSKYTFRLSDLDV